MVLRRYFPSKSFLLNHSPQDLLGYYLNKKTNCNFSFRRCRGHKGVEFFGFDSSSSCWKRTSISILYDVLAGHHHKFDYRKTIQTSRTILQKIKVDHESTQFRNRKTRDHNPHLIFAFAVQIRGCHRWCWEWRTTTKSLWKSFEVPWKKKLPTTVKFLLCLPILNAIGTWNSSGEEVSKALIKSTLKSMPVSC